MGESASSYQQIFKSKQAVFKFIAPHITDREMEARCFIGLGKFEVDLPRNQ